MDITLIGVDLGKTVFHLHGVDARGSKRFAKQVSRECLISEISQFKPCRIVLEACGGSNYWAREFEKFGHAVELIAPQYVKPFVMRSKTDSKDAEAITVAARQPNMRYVPRRTEDQQDIQNLHRIRTRLIKARTALVNEARGLLGEYGIVIPQGRRVFHKLFLKIVTQNSTRLSSLALETFYDLWKEYLSVHER